MSYVQWCPFIYNVQSQEDVLLYSSFDGKNIIKYENGDVKFIYRRLSECVSHFSISSHEKTFFLAGLSKKIYICDNAEITEMDIHNSIDEILIPYSYNDCIRAIGCKSSRVFELYDDGMKVVDDLNNSGEWFTRGKLESQYICMWDNMKKKIMLFNTKYSDFLIVPWLEETIIDVIESNGYLYVLYGKNKISIYDYQNQVIRATINIMDKYDMQKIVQYKNAIYVFADTGNLITRICVSDENLSKEIITIDIDKNVHMHWKDLGDGKVLGVIESCNYENALIVQFDLNNNCMSEIPIYSAYCRYVMNEKDMGGIIEEKSGFGLNDFIKNL